MISLPGISELRRITQSLATLDLILSPEWEYRYYSFDSKWAPDGQMASMRNGSGDEWFILFNDADWAGLKGLAHESPAAGIDGLSARLQKAVPSKFKSFATEPAFRWDETTFCHWCPGQGSAWEAPAVLDDVDTGADELLAIIGSGPEGYQQFALEYYECEVDKELVKKVFQHHRIDQKLVWSLDHEIALDDIQDGLLDIGYP
jgi:hypothetical protein